LTLIEAPVTQPTQGLHLGWGYECLWFDTPMRLPIGRSHTDSNGGLAWYWESANPNQSQNPEPNLTLPTKRSEAVPWDFFRL